MGLLLGLISLVGIVVSTMSLYEYVVVATGIQTGASLCKFSETFDCEPAIRSSWSAIFNIPLASYGMAFFSMFLILSLLSAEKSLFPKQKSASVFLLLSLLASLFSIFMFFISALVVGKYCPLCIATYLVCFSLFALSWWYGREDGFIQRVKLGVFSILSLPLLMIGAGKYREQAGVATARVGLVGAFFVVFSVLAFPDYLANQFLVEVAVKQDVLGRWMSEPQTELDVSLDGVVNGDFTIGNPSAPIQVVEFSDFECPACRNAHGWLSPLLKEYKDKVFFVFRNFPLGKACNSMMPHDMHPSACFAAEFARCAGEQGKFFAVADFFADFTLFDEENQPSKVEEAILKSSNILGLDDQAIDGCLKSGRQRARIAQDVKDGQRLQIQGTPSVWINGRALQPVNRDAMKAVFDEILESSVK